MMTRRDVLGLLDALGCGCLAVVGAVLAAAAVLLRGWW